MSYNWIHTLLAFLDWLLPLSNISLRLLCFFSWLDNSLSFFFFFFLLSNIPFWNIKCSLSIHLPKDISVISKFWQLWIKMLYTTMWRFLCEPEFPITLDKSIFSFFKETTKLFSKVTVCINLHSYQPWVRVAIALHPC